MSSIPVSLSLICSAVSAITILGNPLEIYFYSTQFFMVMISFIPFHLALAYIYIPVYFNLNLNSAYEYIEMRFNTVVRLFISIMACVHVVISMAIAIYAPSLGIHQVTGIDTKISTAVIYIVCIFYSTIGGLKAVLWTDCLQAGIMLISLATVVGKGVGDVGGVGEVWRIAKDLDRIEFFNFDFDPRTRHTFWTCLIGGYFFWIPSYAATQLQVQRFLSMPTLSRARRALVFNFIGLVVILGLVFFSGLVILAKYKDCDPIKAEIIEKSDQLVPYFVDQTVAGTPGLLGLFLAGITAASMSSLSSGLTALASITTYDYVTKLYPHFSDTKLAWISKINCLILGLVSFGFVFIIENMGNILPATSSFLGIMLGPTFGLFSLGMFFPQANSKGSLTGIVISILLMAMHAIGINLNSVKSQLPDQKAPMSVEGCSNDTLFNFYSHNQSISFAQEPQMNWKDNDDSFLIQILSISYMYYSALGSIFTILFGLLASIMIDQYEQRKGIERKLINERFISPPILLIWKKIFSNSYLSKWLFVEVEEKDKIHVSQVNNDSIGNGNSNASTTVIKE